MAAQAPCDLGHEVFRQPQGSESLLEGLGGVLRLTAIPCEALVSLEAAALSSFSLFVGISFVWGHDVLLYFVRGDAGCRISTDTEHLPFVSVSAALRLRHALPGLPAFFCPLYALYIRPNDLANSHTVCCTPHRPREGGR